MERARVSEWGVTVIEASCFTCEAGDHGRSKVTRKRKNHVRQQAEVREEDLPVEAMESCFLLLLSTNLMYQ